MDHSNIIAENHITVTRPLFDEGMRAIENTYFKETLTKGAFLVAALCLGVGVYQFYKGGSLLFLVGECIFVAAALVWLLVLLPKRKRNRKYKAMKSGADTLPTRVTRFYHSQCCITTNTGKEITIPYTDVVMWQETEHLWILRCANNMGLLLDKEGFVAGDFEHIMELLPEE